MGDLVESNLYLINYVIKKMNIFNMSDYEDYYQVGVIGLINAANTYNDTLKITFSTYAYACIKNEILRYLKKTENFDISLQENLYDKIIIEDTISDDKPEILETLILKETCNELLDLIKSELNDIEYKVISMLYGIGCKEYKQKEIEALLNIPQYKISRIKYKAFKKIKKVID